MKELLLFSLVVVMLIAVIMATKSEGFYVCKGCGSANEISYTSIRNPYYWPFAGTDNISGVVNTMYTGKEITELGGDAVARDLAGLDSCGVRGATHDGLIRLAHHSEPDHVPLTE